MIFAAEIYINSRQISATVILMSVERYVSYQYPIRRERVSKPHVKKASPKWVFSECSRCSLLNLLHRVLIRWTVQC